MANGSRGYSALFIIRSYYSNKYPTYFFISFSAGYRISKFTVLDSYKGNGLLQNIRHVIDTQTNTTYIELKIVDSSSKNNNITVSIPANIDGYGNGDWESTDGESTEETVEGVTVISSLDLTV